jgi:phosphopantothenoylcysteine synthetase/decarboxylase
MGCNCKTKSGFEVPEKNEFFKLTNKEKAKVFLHYTFKVLGFLVGILLLPLINIAIIWFMFNTIVLTKDVNIVNLISKFVGKKNDDDDDDYDDEDDDDDDFYGLTEDDVVMVDVEDITNKY